MTILFSNCSCKIHKSGIFGPKFRHFCFFLKFCKQTHLRVLISNMTIVFLQFLPKNTEIRYFWVKNTKIRNFWSQFQAFSLFHDILQVDKFEGADFKYENIIFKFQTKKSRITHFWFQIETFFFRKICNQTNLRALISNMTMAFSNSSPKIPK